MTYLGKHRPTPSTPPKQKLDWAKIILITVVALAYGAVAYGVWRACFS